MNKYKCLIFIIIIIIIYYINQYNLSKIENIGENYYYKNNNNAKVYDILHENTIHEEKFEFASDILIIILAILLIYINFDLFYLAIGYITTIFIIRMVTVLITILPKHHLCDINNNSRSFRGGCYDKIFSGHFAIILIFTLILYKNNYINMLLLILINLVSSSFIILSRCHYTIDLVVSFFVTMFIYQNNFNFCLLIDKYF
jgi:hypothetical protein